MSESIYQQVDTATQSKLYITTGGDSFRKNYWYRVLGIENGMIKLLWGDCGNPDNPQDIEYLTPEEWRTYVSPDGQGLYKQVGFWDFQPANNPANSDIQFANKNPAAAGIKLYELKKENRRLREALQELQGVVGYNSPAHHVINDALLSEE